MTDGIIKLTEQVFEQMPLLVLWVAQSGRVNRCNKRFESLCGWPKERDLTLHAFFVHEDSKSILELVNDNRSAQYGQLGVYKLNTIDGRELYIEWHWQTLSDSSRVGQVEDIFVLQGVDKTAEHNSLHQATLLEQRLNESQNVLNEVQRVAKVGYWRLDLQTMRATWSPQVYSIIEIDPNQTDNLFELFTQRIHPDDRAEGVARFENAMATGSLLSDQRRLLLPDGRVKHIRQRAEFMRVKIGEAGQPAVLVGVIEDCTEQIEAYQKIFETEQQFEALVDASPVGVYKADSAGKAIFANRRCTEITGLSWDELAKGYWHTNLDPLDRDLVVQRWSESIKLQRVFRMEYRFRRTDGGTIWVLGHCIPVRGASGAVIYYIGTLTDITEQRNALAALSQSEQKYKQLVEHAQVGIFMTDQYGRFLEVNAAGAKMLGYHRDEALQLGISDIVLPDAPPNFALVREQGAISVERDLVCKDGGTVAVSLSVGMIANGNMIGICVDLTERRRAQQQLEIAHKNIENQARLLMQVFRYTPECLVVLNTQFEVIRASCSFVRMFAPMANAIEGESVFQYIRGLNRSEIFDALKNTGVFVVSEYRLNTTANGDENVVYCDITLTPIFEQGGRVESYLLQLHDVTRQFMSTFQTKQTLAERETLLREIHHRVKNNLQVIAGLLHFQSKKASSLHDRESLDDARNRLAAMILVHETLYQSNELSRIDMSVYIHSLIAAIVQTQTTGGSVQVELKIESIELPIESALPCGMLLCELVTNSYKHAFGQGVVGVVDVLMFELEDEITLSVKDNGVGLAQGVDFTSVLSFGWHLVRNLVEQLHGSIDISNKSGLSVTIRFKKSNSAASFSDYSTRDTSTSQGEIKCKRVFIVEDEAVIAMELEDRLEALGYEVCGHASKAQMALSQIRQTQPDVVLLDVNLGSGMSGIDLAKQLQSDSQIAIVFITAYSSSEFAHKITGVTDFTYLVKPFAPLDLQAAIERVLKKEPT